MRNGDRWGRRREGISERLKSGRERDAVGVGGKEGWKRGRERET